MNGSEFFKPKSLFRTFLSVTLCESKCIFILRASSSPCTFFPCCLSSRISCYLLSVPIFCSKIVLLPLHPVIGMYSCILPRLAGRIFIRSFGMSCFVCIVWSCQDIFSVSLLMPVPSDLLLRVVFFNCVTLFFSSQHISAFVLCLSIFCSSSKTSYLCFQ